MNGRASRLSRLLWTLLCLMAAATGQPQSREVPEPNVFESMATRHGSRVVSSIVVGRIDSAEAQAIVSAVTLENPSSSPHRVRGVRIDLQNDSSSDRIYVAEGELAELKRELDVMDCRISGSRDDSGAPYRMAGIARCRPSQTVPQAYCPGYYTTPDSEGLSLATFSGGNFRFPERRPSALANALGKALDDFGLDDDVPPPKPPELSAKELDKIVASAIHFFPELALSPGVKTAGYRGRDDKLSASVIFWPYEQDENLAYSRLVFCTAIDDPARSWACDRSQPRGYLSIPGQEQQVVIAGALDRDTATSLIAFATQKLRDEPHYDDLDDWTFSLIRVPDQHVETFKVMGSDVADRSVLFEIAETGHERQERFELVRVARYERDSCPGG
ncbi:MAG: hypothetical protein AAFX10_09065 [Pseudomonadota bacterium]